MAANVEVVITATDKASGTIKNVTKSTDNWLKTLNNTVKGVTGLDISTIGLSTAIIKAGKFIIDATNETQKYNLAMVDMARKMGTTTEEASRLVQVGDDVRLSQEQISTAMTYAVRNGIQPNIEGLAGLADKYLALEDPVQRGQLLLKTFGRAGMDMGKLLEKGGDGIRSMSAAIEEGLIVTEEAARASKRYYDQVDRLNDSWTATKMTIGNGVIPTLANLLDAINRAGYSVGGYKTLIELSKVQLEQHAIASGYAAEETGYLKNAIDNVNTAFETEYETLIETNGATEKLTTSFLFQKAAANLDAQAAYDLALDMGILDKNSLSASAAIDAAGKMLASKKITLQEYRDLVKGINQQLDSITEKNGITIDMYVDVWYRSHGIVPSGQTNSTYQATGPTGTTGVARAAGGPASGMTWVGENGPELVSLPGGSRVLSNKESTQSAGFDYNKLERTLVRVFRDAGQRA